MSPSSPPPGPSDARRARPSRRRAAGAALAGSLLVHLALLAWLAREAAPDLFTPPVPPEVDVQLGLAPPLPLLGPSPETAEPPRPRAPAAERPRATPPAPPRPLAAPPRPVQPPPVQPRPLQPSPLKPSPAPARPPAAEPRPRAAPSVPALPFPPAAAPSAGAGQRPHPQSPWAVQPDDGQGGVRGFLRATVGCSHEDYLRLSEAERAACDRRLGREGRQAAARIDALPAEARAAFDQAVDARERARNARMSEPFAPCRSEGSGPEHSCLNLPSKHPSE